MASPSATRVVRQQCGHPKTKKTSCGRTQMRSNRAQSTKKRHLWRGKRKGKEKHSLRRGARRGLGTDLRGAWDRNRCFPSRPRRTAMRKRGWGRRSVPPRIGATVEVSERVFYMQKKTAMFPEQTHLSRRCGRACAAVTSSGG